MDSLPKSLDWVIPQQVAVGRFPRQEELPWLGRQGIRAILSLCNPTEAVLSQEAQKQFDCQCIPLPDSHQDRLLEPDALKVAVEALATTLAKTGPVYVHCVAGIERSPTVCIAYLCAYHNLELWEALNWLKQVHPRSAPTSEQLQAIRIYLSQQ